MNIDSGVQLERNFVYGSEYEYDSSPFLVNLREFSVPCAVCYSAEREVKIMIPAKVNCLPTWTREYYGYLMSEYQNHRRISFECVDIDAEGIPGTESNADAVLLYHAESRCNSNGINCPP